MRYVASSFGSGGDFLPTMAVAHALAKEGHDVCFLTNPFHERAVRAAGLEYVAAGEHVDLYRRIIDDPDLLDMSRGGMGFLDELITAHMAALYRIGGQLLRSRHVDAVIGSNLSQGVFWAASERRIPGVMISATVVGWLSGRAPAQFLDFEIPAWLLPRAAGLTRAIVAGLADHKLRCIARTIGATSFDASMTAVEARLALNAGMWPELLRPPSPGDLSNMRACGFARAGHLAATAPGLSRELEAFLAAGEPPVVIALGSIFSLGSDALVADAADACAAIGRRCVLVGRPPRDRELPAGTLVVPYATYHLLFPRAAATVIHGGAGTTGEALRSGRPSVVVPLAFDQFGLAWQVERLHAGVRVPKRARDRDAIARALRLCCEDERIARGAAEVAETLRSAPDGADLAARLITDLK